MGWENVDVSGCGESLLAWYQELDRGRREDNPNLGSSDENDTGNEIVATIERIELLYERDC